MSRQPRHRPPPTPVAWQPASYSSVGATALGGPDTVTPSKTAGWMAGGVKSRRRARRPRRAVCGGTYRQGRINGTRQRQPSVGADDSVRPTATTAHARLNGTLHRQPRRAGPMCPANTAPPPPPIKKQGGAKPLPYMIHHSFFNLRFPQWSRRPAPRRRRTAPPPVRVSWPAGARQR